MNAYLSKPFREEQLVSVISKWLSSTSIKSGNAGTMATKKELYDLSNLRSLGNNNASFETKMIQLFIEQAPLSVSEIKNALANSDFKKIERIAHN